MILNRHKLNKHLQGQCYSAIFVESLQTSVPSSLCFLTVNSVQNIANCRWNYHYTSSMWRWYVMWNATNLYFVLLCVMLSLCIPTFHMIFSNLLPPFFSAPSFISTLTYLLHDFWCWNHELILSDLPACVSPVSILASNWCTCFYFLPTNFCRTFLIHYGAPPSCTTHHTHISGHFHVLVVAPPSLPCSPPPSCIDSSPLSQALPLHRGTSCSHEDGGMPSCGRSSFHSIRRCCNVCFSKLHQKGFMLPSKLNKGWDVLNSEFMSLLCSGPSGRKCVT